MRHLLYTLALGLLLGSASSASAQERKTATKDDAKSETRLRGQLPANFRQLGLSEEQRQKIYKVQNDYADKIQELEEQIEKLKADRNKAYVKVLTKAQQDRLAEILKEKAGDDKSPGK